MSSFLPSCSIRKVTCAAVTKAETCAQDLQVQSSCQAEGLAARSRQLGQEVLIKGTCSSAGN